MRPNIALPAPPVPGHGQRLLGRGEQTPRLWLGSHRTTLNWYLKPGWCVATSGFFFWLNEKGWCQRIWGGWSKAEPSPIPRVWPVWAPAKCY